MASSTIPEWIALMCYRLKNPQNLKSQNHRRDDGAEEDDRSRRATAPASAPKTNMMDIDYRDAVIEMGDNGRRLRPIEMETLSMACIPTTPTTNSNTNLHLQALDLSYALDDPDSIQVLARSVLPNHPTLRRLSLLCNGLHAIHAQWIAAALSSPHCVLEELNLDCNRIGPDGAIALARSLTSAKPGNCSSSCSALLRLGLGGNQIRDAGAKALADMLKSNTRLQVLGLSYNMVGTVGVRALMEALSSSSKINNNNIRSQSSSSLRELDLSINNVGNNSNNNSRRTTSNTTDQREGGAEAKDEEEDWCQVIGTCLSQNSSLTHLSLYFHSVTHKGAMALERGLKMNYSLEVLKLDDGIGRGGGSSSSMMTIHQRKRICQLLQHNIRMKHLYQQVTEHQQSIPTVLWPNVLALLTKKPDFLFAIVRSRLPELLMEEEG